MKSPLFTSPKGSRSTPALPEQILSLAEEGTLPRSTSVPLISPAERSEWPSPRPASAVPGEDDEGPPVGGQGPYDFQRRQSRSGNLSEMVDFTAQPAAVEQPASRASQSTYNDGNISRHERRSLPRYTASGTNYEKKYGPDAYGKELGADARVWRVYNDEAQVADGEMVKELNGTTDVLLVFAGLFSAVVTTFLSQSSQSLNTDYAQITANLVYELVHIQRAIAANSRVDDVPVSGLTPNSTTHSKTDLWVNGLWLISLTLSLLAALISVLAKQWIQHYNAITGGTARDRANIRHYRLLAFDRWNVPFIIGFLPALLSTALLLFLGGLAVYFAPLDSTIAFVIIGFTSAIALLYMISIVLPIIVTHCAYKTPVSDYIVLVAQFLARFFGLICSIAKHIVRHRRVFWPMLDMPWSTHGLDLKALERIEVARQEDALIAESLDWLCFSSLNSSASSIATQAIAAYPKPLVLGSTLLNVCSLAENALQAVEQKCRTPESLLKEADAAERLARALLHHPANPTMLFGHIWESQLWPELYESRALIASPQTHALLRLTLLIRFGSEEGAMLSMPGLQRLRHAVDVDSFDPPLTALKLHPVVWRELHRAVRLGILLFDELSLQRAGQSNTERGRSRQSRLSSHSDRNSRVWDTYQQVRDRRAQLNTPPMTIRPDFPLEDTAMSLREYAMERGWSEGPDALLDGMRELKNLAGVQMLSMDAQQQLAPEGDSTETMTTVSGPIAGPEDDAQGGRLRTETSSISSWLSGMDYQPSVLNPNNVRFDGVPVGARPSGRASTEELARASGEVSVGAAPDASTALYTLVNRDDGGPTADANGGNDRNDEEVTQRDH
ncbi:hypothetical protein GGG16DRAFT_107547 [Schizophyllum commune]